MIYTFMNFIDNCVNLFAQINFKGFLIFLFTEQIILVESKLRELAIQFVFLLLFLKLWRSFIQEKYSNMKRPNHQLSQFIEQRNVLGRVCTSSEKHQACLLIISNMSIEMSVSVYFSIGLLAGSLLISFGWPFITGFSFIFLFLFFVMMLLLGPSCQRCQELFQLIQLVFLLAVFDDFKRIQGLVLLRIP